MTAKLAFKEDGSVEAPSQEELENLDIDTYVIAYTNGTLTDGRPYYAYIAVMPSKYQEFYDLTSNGKPMVLSNYGEVIVADFEEKPPQEIIDFMVENYGFENDLGANLQKELSQQRGASIQKVELDRIQDIVSKMKQKDSSPEMAKKMADTMSDTPEESKGTPNGAATNGAVDPRLNDIVSMLKSGQKPN